MKFNKPHNRTAGNKRAMRWFYTATFVVLAFTGFGQMPIFKRYYLADIPGMAWAANFYLTHMIHYIGAIFLLGFVAYVFFVYLLVGRRTSKLTASAYVRIVLLAGIIMTGIFRVLKNLPDVTFSPNFTLFIDLSHLGFVMVYLLTGLFFLVIGSGWITRELT
jgi:heme A synthase